MKISVIGAAGMIGSQIVAEATSRGLEVQAYTRSGNGVGELPSQALDISDTAAVAKVVNDSDATVISVAGRDDYAAVVAAHKALIEAKPAGRMVVIGGAGSLQVGEGRLLETPGFPAEYLPESTAFSTVLDLYRAADGIDWTLVAPSPVIAPGKRTGYVTALDTPAGGFVSTQDFAEAIVDELQNPAHKGRRFTVASADEAVAQS
ncbi:NAD(P)H-binding protein [Tessaracoccus lubricantis]|uniref:NAD(P)H-binding protein n=1 Tax=Tessaracoccus lubricantis TaxID=545543 RepID=A0ABP9FI81_9ACTN